MIPSKFQGAIFSAIKQSSESLIVDACAGSGKTTTTVHGSTLIDPYLHILFLAFNKSIADELKTRIPRHATALTFNSLGHRAVMKLFGRVQLDPNKTRRLIKANLDIEDVIQFGDDIKKLIGLAKSYCISPEGYSGTNDTYKNFGWLIDRFGVEAHEDNYQHLIDLTRLILEASIRETSIIDYDDQIYFPVVLNIKMLKYDVLFVDELQDVSPVQLNLIQKSIKPTGRVIGVGDENQAIYGFRGSDSGSMKKFESRFDCKRLPLSITYRCAKNIVTYANQYVEEIQAFENAPDGLVCSWINYRSPDFRKTDLMMCRNTAPLISMAFAMIARRVSVKVLGRDIGQNLINLITRLKPSGLFGEGGLEEKLKEWADYEIEKYNKEGKEDKVESVADRRDSIIAFLDNSLASSVDRLKEEIKALFNKDDECLTLSTIHRAKGLEAPRAFILNPELMPSKWARQEWAKQQETNLLYVAITRAKTELIFIRDIDYEVEL